MIYRGLGSGIIRVMKENVAIDFVNEESANQFRTIIWRTAKKKGEEFLKEGEEFLKEGKEFLKEGKEFLKEREEFLKEREESKKEFRKVQQMICSMISKKPETTISEMATNIGLSDRQIRKYIKRLMEMKLIIREGGRKHGKWVLLDNKG